MHPIIQRLASSDAKVQDLQTLTIDELTSISQQLQTAMLEIEDAIENAQASQSLNFKVSYPNGIYWLIDTTNVLPDVIYYERAASGIYMDGDNLVSSTIQLSWNNTTSHISRHLNTQQVLSSEAVEIIEDFENFQHEYTEIDYNTFHKIFNDYQTVYNEWNSATIIATGKASVLLQSAGDFVTNKH